MKKNSKNKRIFEVLWTVDAVLRLFESHYCILRWIKLIGGSFSLKKKKKKNIFSNGEHLLWKTLEIAGKTRISGYSQKILIPADRTHP
jgi:hypothetical protein